MNTYIAKIWAALAAAVIAAALMSNGALAQATFNGTPTQQTATHLDAGQAFQTSNTSAATVTIPAVSSQYAYITQISLENCAGASAVTAAAPTTVTSTNLNGYALQVGSGTTAGACQPPHIDVWANGFKSAAPGTAVTFVLPTFATNQTLRLNVTYYYGF